MAAAKGLVTAVDPPPLLDGTWQPDSTDGISRWLGGFGLWWVDERDNDVRTLGAMAHRELVAAETIAKTNGIDAKTELDGAWRLLALGQVTDATGINPFRGEIEYGIAHFTEVLRIARDVIHRAKDGSSSVTIDTEAGIPIRDVVEVGAAPVTRPRASSRTPIHATRRGATRRVPHRGARDYRFRDRSAAA